MRQPIKPIIKKGKVRKDGTSLIFVQYCYSSTRRVLIGSDISVPADYWNNKTCTISPKLPTESGTPENLQSQFREKLRKAERLIDYALQNAVCPMRFLKRNFVHGDLTYLER